LTLAPAELLNGNGYTIDAKARVVGYMGQFTLRAPAATFVPNGTEMLAIRDKLGGHRRASTGKRTHTR
jgi:hypothetical protein